MLAALMLALLQPAAAPPAGAPTATTAPDPFATDKALIAQLADLARAGKPNEMLALIDPFLARKDAEAAAERRRTYSGQTLPMVLMNMGAAAKEKIAAVDAGPAYAQAAYFKGYALLELGRVADAGSFYERALALSPFNPTFHSEYGFWLRKQGKMDLALAQYQQAENLSGLAGGGQAERLAKAAALRGQGYVLIDLGRLDEAQARYEASLKFDPTSIVARRDLAFIRQKRGQLGKSLS